MKLRPIYLSLTLILCSPVAILAQSAPVTFNRQNQTNLNTWGNLKLTHTLSKHESPVYGVAFNPVNNNLVSVGSYNDPKMRFWQVQQGREIKEQRAHGSAVNALVYTPDGEKIITAGQASDIRIWHGETGALESSFFIHQNNVLALAVSPDSKILVSGALDGIKVWNLEFKRLAYNLTGIGEATSALAIHPEGRILASGSLSGKVTLWDLSTGQKIRQFTPHQSKINGLIFTPDGKQLLTSAEETRVKVWNSQTLQPLANFGQHSNRLRTMALSPDGNTLASGGNDGVRIWDYSSRQQIAFIPYHQDWVQSLAFSADGNILATAGFNTDIYLWEKNSAQK